MTPIELAKKAREESQSSIAVPYAVSVWRINDRGYDIARTRSFDTLESAREFFDGLHTGAHYAELREFNGKGYPAIAKRGK